MGGVVSAIGSGIGDVAGAVGGLLGITGGQSATSPGNVNAVNPQVAQIQQQQLASANNFNSNINNYEGDQINAATDASRLQTQQQQQASTTNSNARGMLYGGYNQNQSNNVSANNAASLNNQIANINVSAQAAGQQLNNQAVNSGLVSQGLNQTYNNAVYNAGMAQAQANAQGINNGIAAIPVVGGLLSSI